MTDHVTADRWAPGVWSHEALMQMQARLDPVRIVHYAEAWVRVVDAASATLEELAQRLTRLIEDSWHGRGADAALQAVLDYVAASLDGLRRARLIAKGLTDLAGAAADVRGAITPPEPGDSPREAEQRLEEALDQVRRLYSGPAVAAGGAAAEVPFSAVAVPAAGAPPEATVPAGSSTPFAPPAAAALSHMPSSVYPSPSPYDAVRPATLGRVDDVRPAGVSAEIHHPVAPSATTELRATPGSPAAPLAGPSPSQPPAVAGAAPPALRPSTPAVPFLGGGYSGYAGREGVAEHRTPSYLISLDHAHDLIGVLPKVAPPVIGE